MTGRRPDKAAVNRIFGVELPQASTDERDLQPAASERDRDDWLRENVPPHHI